MLHVLQITASAFEAAAQRWPDLFGSVQQSGEQRAQLREAMRTVRPVLVRGYESMVSNGDVAWGGAEGKETWAGQSAQ